MSPYSQYAMRNADLQPAFHCKITNSGAFSTGGRQQRDTVCHPKGWRHKPGRGRRSTVSYLFGAPGLQALQRLYLKIPGTPLLLLLSHRPGTFSQDSTGQWLDHGTCRSSAAAADIVLRSDQQCFPLSQWNSHIASIHKACWGSKESMPVL